MAINSVNIISKEPTKGRSQVYNPSTGNYVKRDTTTGQFIDVKSDGTPFKGVKKEAITISIKPNPSVKKDTAQKAESAVIKVKNSKKK